MAAAGARALAAPAVLAACAGGRLDGADGPQGWRGHGPRGPGQPTFSLDSAARCVSKAGPRRLHGPIRHDCGDDAFFMAQPTEATATVGIADGVSSWSRMGIDPALFAWELMRHCELLAEGVGMSRPRDVMSRGYWNMVRSGSAPSGSSTACVASLDRPGGRLTVANLGDSGVLLLRGGGARVVLQTQEQQHYFNCPYQLMFVQPNDQAGQARGDDPESSAEYSAQAEDGDLLVMATDGFFDNVFQENALKVIAGMCETKPGEIAEALVRLAHSRSQLQEHTPFSVSAQRHGVRPMPGRGVQPGALGAAASEEAVCELHDVVRGGFVRVFAGVFPRLQFSLCVAAVGR
ncbi:unnamed protein product [Prorocentrum cordatum]|uniref:Protein phosphatase n=1 Tax=Prorocentrum cordatum TaxID=2364126 RepID=A0ABN9WE82_9DINO|nr:unnamed protein product [Polarella glacialis]